MNNVDYKTTVDDQPLKTAAEDQLGLAVYQKALIDYIDHANTPITISIQGDWGSGKTSMMNAVQEALCGNRGDAKHFYGIWINTWQFSLIDSPAQAIISILQVITNRMISINPNGSHNEDIIKILGRLGANVKATYDFLSPILSVVAPDLKKIGDSGINQIKKFFELLQKWRKYNNKELNSDRDSLVTQLKNGVAGLVKEIIEGNKQGGQIYHIDRNKKGFIFFIDDLDRIDPGLAVNILEIIKNVFDINYCVVLVAVDYNVIVKGLEPKLGRFDESNKQKYRTYFDKLVQIHFALPMTYYNLKEFLSKNLHEISFFNSEDDQNIKDSVITELSEIAQNSVGRNPRNLKRLINTLSLTDALRRANFDEYGSLSLYKDTKLDHNYVDDPSQTPLNKKKVIFTLACIQIAYYDIYLAMVDNVNFINWDNRGFWDLSDSEFVDEYQPTIDEIVSIKNNNKINEKLSKFGCSCDKQSYWEYELYKFCQQKPYLKHHIAELLFLFNYIDCIFRHNHVFMLYEIGVIMSWLVVSDIGKIYDNHFSCDENKDKHQNNTSSNE